MAIVGVMYIALFIVLSTDRRDWPLQMHYNGFGDIRHQISHGDNRYRLDLLTLIDSIWLIFHMGLGVRLVVNR